MARIEGELVINRPIDEVFDFVADERNEPRYNPRTGPVSSGSWKERRVLVGKPSESGA